MKSFENFLREEVDLRGNKGIPSDFMSKAEEEARIKKGVRPDDESQMRNIWPEFERQMNQSNSLIMKRNGQRLTPEQIEERYTQLEDLAKRVVLEEFNEVLKDSSVPIELSISLVRQGRVSDEIPNLGQVPQRAEQPQQPQQPQPEPVDLSSAIDKKKILNMIAQAAGKKTKEIIRYSTTIQQELENIFGNDADTILDCWVRMSEQADKMDWVIPIDKKSSMMKNAPGGMAGACEVIWESLSGQKYDIKLILEKEATKVTIRAVGIDFPMLIHESVKGIYSYLQSVSIKKGEEAKIVKKATSSFTDEAQDFRYGPPALQMLIDFVNKFPDSTKYKQLHAKVYKFLAFDKERAKAQLKSIQEIAEKETGSQKQQYNELLQRMKKRVDLYKTDKQFLDIMNSLFSCFDLINGDFTINEDNFNDSHAKKEIKEIVDFIVKEDEYLSSRTAEYERYEKEEEQRSKRSKEEEEEVESEMDKLIKQSLSVEKESDEKDYENMTDSELEKLSQSEIQQAIDKAVGEENYEFADKLTKKFLKGESKKVWETELKRINEMYRRK